MTTSTVPERLKELADSRPQALALEGPGGPLTFADLWESCLALAAVLAGRLEETEGPRPVGVLVTPDDVDQVVALGAVLVAGHAPLLIDPRVPGKLQREWVRAAGATLVLADSTHAVTAHRRFGVPVVISDDCEDDVLGGPRVVAPHDRALLVPEPYGEDGSVVVGSLSHADLVRRARSDAEALGLTGADRVGTTLSLASPLGTRVRLMGLLTGAATVLDPTPARGRTALSEWLAGADISVIALTPTLIDLANATPCAALPGLRRVMVLAPATAVDAEPAQLRAAPDVPHVPVDDRHADPDTEGEHEVADEPATCPEEADDTSPGLDPIETTLVALWEELLGIHPVGLQDDFFDLGGHSLLAARLLVLLEQRAGVRLPMAIFLEATTIEDLAAAVRQAGDESAHPVVVMIQPGDPARAPLFVTHDLQGSTWRFRDLARAVGADQPVFGFESPMLEGHLEFATIEALAEHYVQAMRTVQAHGPYHLCGYSFGGVLAFEMARVLRHHGDDVALLGIIDVGPGYRGLDYSRSRHPPLPYLRDAVEQTSDALPAWASPVRHLWLNRWVLAWRWQRLLRRGETVPPDERLWFAWWAHWNLVGPQWAASNYDRRIDLFWAETTVGTDRTMGWGSYAAKVVVHRIAGEHEELMAAPAVTEIGIGLAGLLPADPAADTV